MNLNIKEYMYSLCNSLDHRCAQKWLFWIIKNKTKQNKKKKNHGVIGFQIHPPGHRTADKL